MHKKAVEASSIYCWAKFGLHPDILLCISMKLREVFNATLKGALKGLISP